MKPLMGLVLVAITSVTTQNVHAQLTAQTSADTSHYIYDVGTIKPCDTIPVVNLREVNVVYFKTPTEWAQYYRYKAQIEKVMPYVKIAKQLYTELKEDKENEKKRVYKHDRKELEKQMRGKFEKELKDLTTSQGEMLFKLVNRETGNNAYDLIKEIKNPFTA